MGLSRKAEEPNSRQAEKKESKEARKIKKAKKQESRAAEKLGKKTYTKKDHQNIALQLLPVKEPFNCHLMPIM